jgi:hypothetical protein
LGYTVKLSHSQILITVGSESDTALQGCIFSGYYGKYMEFHDANELLMEMQELCDSVQYPQSTFKCRTFGVKHRKQVIRRAGDFVDEDINEEVEQDKATFLVHIQFRQNATWQGSINWVEKDRTQNFRSALEMLRLIDEAGSPGVRKTMEWDERSEE